MDCGVIDSLQNGVPFQEAIEDFRSFGGDLLISSLLIVVATNGAGEAILAGILVPAICIPLSKLKAE